MAVAGGKSDEDGLGRWQPPIRASGSRVLSMVGAPYAPGFTLSADLVDMVQEVAWILVDADGACLP